MKLLRLFDNQDYNVSAKHIIRYASRAIIFKDGLLAMVKSSKYGFVKFPGGGVFKNETPLQTVKRETLEETGLTLIDETIKEYGIIKELRKSVYDDNIFEQISYYYTAEVEDSVKELKLEKYEEDDGYHLVYITVEEAYQINDEIYQKTGNTFIPRENAILEMLKNESK